MKRHKYLYYNPRGFANEYTIYRVDPTSVEQMGMVKRLMENDSLDEVSWINLREAKRRLSSSVRGAKEFGGDRFYGGGIVDISEDAELFG